MKGNPELEELFSIHPFNEFGRYALGVVQDSQAHLLVGQKQVPKDIERGMGDLIIFTDLFYCVDVQKIGFEHSQHKAQAVRRIRDQHLRQEGMGMSAGETLYPRDT